MGMVVDAKSMRKWSQSGRHPPRRSGRRAEPFVDGGVEPAVEDLLNDPVTAAIMRCDRVSLPALRALVTATRETLLARPRA